MSNADRDRNISRQARSRRGLLTTQELRALELRRSSTHDRVEAGRFVHVARGVYLEAACPFDHDAFVLAALLSSRREAGWVDRTAAQLHQLLPTTRGRASIGRPTVKKARTFTTYEPLTDGGRGLIHLRKATFPAGELTPIHGGQATTVARTLLDLARFDDGDFDRAWREALYRDTLDPASIEAVLAVGRRDGASRLRAKLHQEFFVDLGAHGIDSPDELDFAQLIVAAGAPPPLVNFWIRTPSGWRRLDLYWPHARLCVELDRWRGHRSRQSFDDDPMRDAELRDLGIFTVRFTKTNTDERPQWCAEHVLRQMREREAR